MTEALALIAAMAGSYVLGSVPVGLLIGKARGVDIRAQGSGNIGATNAMRVLGKPMGMVCFGLDVLKGAAPVVAGGIWLGYLGESALGTAGAFAWFGLGVASVLGHMFSIFLRFKGGKGVATGFGVLLALWPWVTTPAVIALIVWYGTLRITRYVSVASCVAGASVPITVVLASIVRGDLAYAWPFAVITGALSALVVWKHRGNLARVRSGTEPKVGAAGSG